MKWTVRPISDRTTFRGKPAESRFTVKYSDVLALLERELDHLDARELVLEVDVPETAIRLDGQLRADARSATPGVRLAFESNVGDLTYATDAFVRGPASVEVGPAELQDDGTKKRKRRATMSEDWQHNLYAIAKSLEALRMVDRYGVTGRGEQYTGFKALGAGRAMPSSHMTRGEALHVVTAYAGLGVSGPSAPLDELREVHRRARAAVHPDRHAGDRSAWDRVELAATVLGLLRGES